LRAAESGSFFEGFATFHFLRRFSMTSASSASVSFTPAGYHSVTAYMIVDGAAQAIAFYEKAFNAKELSRMAMPDGKIAHAEIKIGDSPIMLADAMEGFRDPRDLGGTPVSFMIYVADVDTIFKQALAAGAKEQRPLQDQFYGDRSGTLVDPFGHVWNVATHVEDVSPEEIDRRYEKMMAEQKS
jgi:PhnB protein